MGIPVLILGASGAGKSTSMRNLNPQGLTLFNVARKALPFRSSEWRQVYQSPSYGGIMKSLIANKQRLYVIDDSQYLMTFFMFAKADERGYDKFTQCAKDFYNLIQTIIRRTSDDTIVYMLHHTEKRDDGGIKAKTQGKMLDSQLTLEGLFSIVLLADHDEKEHWFWTKSNGLNPVKTPLEMFSEERINNDLALVDSTIRDYYGFTTKTNEEQNNG